MQVTVLHKHPKQIVEFHSTGIKNFLFLNVYDNFKKKVGATPAIFHDSINTIKRLVVCAVILWGHVNSALFFFYKITRINTFIFIILIVRLIGFSCYLKTFVSVRKTWIYIFFWITLTICLQFSVIKNFFFHGYKNLKSIYSTTFLLREEKKITLNLFHVRTLARVISFNNVMH